MRVAEVAASCARTPQPTVKTDSVNAAALRNAILMMKPGTELNLTVLRKEKMIQVPIKVGDAKEDAVALKEERNQLGIEVENLTPELARSLGYTQDQGVVITQIDSNSAARLAGLKKGALVMGVNRKKVENVDQFNAALKETTVGRPILLQIKQGESYVFVSLREE